MGGPMAPGGYNAGGYNAGGYNAGGYGGPPMPPHARNGHAPGRSPGPEPPGMRGYSHQPPPHASRDQPPYSNRPPPYGTPSHGGFSPTGYQSHAYAPADAPPYSNRRPAASPPHSNSRHAPLAEQC